jgi:hypothetical protein
MPHFNVGTTARRSERALLRIPIRVEGKDAFGRAFDETTYTQVVNRCGGLIVVSHQLKPDDLIKITNLRNKISCHFRAISLATKSLSGAPEWGVECLEPEAEIWGVRFPTTTEEPPQADLIHALLECQECSSREMAALTLQQYRRLLANSTLQRPCPKCSDTSDWKFGFIEADLEEVLPSIPAPSASGLTRQGGAENRRDRRLVVKVPLGVRLPDGSEETGTTENISKSGLCFACDLEMQVGDIVHVRVGLDASGEQHDVPARIMWRRPGREKGRAYYGAKLERGD